MLVEQRALIGTLDLFDHLGHAIRTEKWGALGSLDVTHLFGDVRALVEQGKQLLVQCIDLHAQTRQGIGL